MVSQRVQSLDRRISHPRPFIYSVIKQRMQMHKSEFRSVFTCARTVYAREGISAFYVSYPTTLVMSIPFTAVQFTVYEQTKRLLNPDNTYSPVSHMVSGGLAGAVAAAVTTPLDVCKTLLQTRGSSDDKVIREARGMIDAGKIVWRRDGLKGFTRGLTPRVLTHMPSNALCWIAYEFFSMCIFFPAQDDTNVFLVIDRGCHPRQLEHVLPRGLGHYLGRVKPSLRSYQLRRQSSCPIQLGVRAKLPNPFFGTLSRQITGCVLAFCMRLRSKLAEVSVFMILDENALYSHFVQSHFSSSLFPCFLRVFSTHTSIHLFLLGSRLSRLDCINLNAGFTGLQAAAVCSTFSRVSCFAW